MDHSYLPPLQHPYPLRGCNSDLAHHSITPSLHHSITPSLWGRIRGRGRRRGRERSPSGLSLRLTPPSPTDQIDRGSQLKQWIIRRLNAIHARDRIKDDLFLLLIVLGDWRGEHDLAQPG